MSTHPVQLHIDPPGETQRVHVVIRIALLLGLGTIGFSWAYGFLYIVLPALVALRILNASAERYLSGDVPRVVRTLRWLASASAYLALLTDVLPTSGAGPVDLQVRASGTPTATSALLRLLGSIPALLLLALLSAAAGVLWMLGAIVVLVRRRMPAAIADFIALVLRYQFRLVAYHLSLVDRYPSFEEAPVAHAAG